MVLVWTRCPRRPDYTTHLWDPDEPGGIAYSPPILDRINAPHDPGDPPRVEDRPFCSGHTWIRDENKNPKLLTVGGEDRSDDDSTTDISYEDQDPTTVGHQNPCNSTGGTCGLHKVYWFNPMATNPENAWSDDPPDLHEGRWYPSVTTSLNQEETRFVPTVLGGTTRGYVEHYEVNVACPPTRYDHWRTFALSIGGSWAGGAWEQQTAPYLWQYYPRPFQLAGPLLLTAGHAVQCENDVPTNPFGGNPVSIITPAQAWSHGPSPNPDDTTLTNATGGAWHYSNGAILHTLNDLSYTEVNPLQRYDLDRVLITGGSQEASDPALLPNDVNVPAQPYTHEWHSGQWIVKASPANARVFSNWVILPDGTLLLVGGGITDSLGAAGGYYSTVEKFIPGQPTGPGIWKTMAPRPDVVVDPNTTLPPPARGYHSVALLLQDGRVAVMGGVRPSTSPYDSLAILPWSSVEIYNPGYTFESSRLRITSTQAASMAYGAPFYLTVNHPARVSYASLIGVSSITHSFDYGQRYVQLMATQTSGAGNIKVLGPPAKTMAPEGYYLLFVVEIRGGVHIPSKGTFVKLTL